MRGLAKSGEKKVDWREFRATAAACKEAAKAAGVTVQRETPPVPLDDAERWRLDQAVAAFRLGSAAADGVQSWVRNSHSFPGSGKSAALAAHIDGALLARRRTSQPWPGPGLCLTLENNSSSPFFG